MEEHSPAYDKFVWDVQRLQLGRYRTTLPVRRSNGIGLDSISVDTIARRPQEDEEEEEEATRKDKKEQKSDQEGQEG